MTTLAQLTMNAGDGIPGSVLKWNLERNAHKFDRVLIVDGQLTDKASKYYGQFPNLEALDSPWKDNHAPQYQRFTDELEDGEWCLYLDDDEAPSDNLIRLCAEIKGVTEAKPDLNDVNIVILPSILYITEDGLRHYRALHKPFPEDSRNGGHTKPVLFKKADSLIFLTSPPPSAHVTPSHGGAQKAIYASGGWYYHFKSAEAYVINDCLFALMNPKAERYTDEEAADFEEALNDSKIHTMQEFREATEEGTWSQKLIDFAYANQDQTDRPISRLWWWYAVICHPEKNTNANLTWEKVVETALADEWHCTYQESKKAALLQESMGGKLALQTIDFIDVPSTTRRMALV
tara:strand:+ start:13631 stop:14671 length:1041 start_codon:yes stop_codon:yes gene_type:complete